MGDAHSDIWFTVASHWNGELSNRECIGNGNVGSDCIELDSDAAMEAVKNKNTTILLLFRSANFHVSVKFILVFTDGRKQSYIETHTVKRDYVFLEQEGLPAVVHDNFNATGHNYLRESLARQSYKTEFSFFHLFQLSK